MALVCYFDAQSQEPYQLTDESNKWYEYGQFGGFGPYPLQTVHAIYFFNGDTMINGINYNKLYINRVDTFFMEPIYLNNTLNYAAAFRQDSLKVYFIMRDSLTENLYCNFSLSVGDTLKYFYNSQNNVVDSITEIPFGTVTRKRYILDNGYSFYEGIGNGLGMFRNYSIGIEGGVYLVCFEQAGITQSVYEFISSTPPVCGLGLTLSFENEIPSLNVSTVFPNPFSTQLTIHLVENEPITLSIYNLIGQELLHQTFSETTTLITEQLPNGIYIYELRNKRGSLKKGKILKQH